MSQKTGTVTLHASADGAHWSAAVAVPGPPPEEVTWTDPPEKVWEVFKSAYEKGATVTISYDDSTQPPTRTGVQAN